MFESKYSKVLTIILIIVIIGIIILLAFLGYDWYQKYFLENDAMEFVNNYTNQVAEEKPEENTDNNINQNEVKNPINDIQSSGNNSTSSGTKIPQFKGYNVVGTMEIPATNFTYPILEKVNNKSLEISVGFLYGAGVNKVGNTVISGHNYRNGMFFSNNKKLNIGDKIHVTDNDGNKITYTIYNKFETTAEDVSFYVRDTSEKPEITLSTCTDDSKARLIILARTE